MPITFPTNPTPVTGDVVTSGNRRWTYNASIPAWESGNVQVMGTLATQNSNAVSVTGGTLSGVTLTGAILTGASVSNTLAFALGTAPAPSITFTGDTNTGVFSPAADTLAFTTNGSEKVRVLSNGNVGIGSTNPTNKLTVVGDISATSAAIPTLTGPVAMTGKVTLTPAQQTGTDDAMTRGLVVAENAHTAWLPVSFNSPSGTVNSSSASAGLQFSAWLTSSAVAGNHRIASSARWPLVRSGSGAQMRLSGSKFSTILFLNSNGITNNEVRILFGVSNSTSTELTAAGLGVVWNSSTTVKLQIHKGVSLVESGNFTIPVFDSSRLNRYMVTWNDATLTLYNQNWEDTAAIGRWVMVGTLTTTDIPATASGAAVNIVTIATGTPAFQTTIYSDAVLYAPYALIP